jgi:hypothetical protein
MKAKVLVAVFALLVSGSFYAQAHPVEGRAGRVTQAAHPAHAAHPIELAGDSMAIMPVWEQAKVMNRLLAEKQAIVLPQVMRESSIDMWIVGRGEGHLYLSLIESEEDGLVRDEPDFLVFFDRGEAMEGAAARGEASGVERLSAEFEELAEIITARDPAAIAVTEARRTRRGPSPGTFSESAKVELEAAIGAARASRMMPAGILTNRWLGTRTPAEVSVFKHVTRIAHEVIAEAYSNKVIVPDVTTVDELNWWILQRYEDLGIGTVDHPTVTIQRSFADREKYDDDDEYFRAFDERFVDDLSPMNGYNMTIRRGDLIFNDTGIKYLGLYTDTQQSAYVLREGETDAPDGLKEAMRHINRFQDLIGEEMRAGRDGNEIGAAAAERARAEGIKNPKLYSHSLMYWFMRYELLGRFFSKEVHNAGSGMSSDGRPGWPGNEVRENTYFALELDVEYELPEWDGQNIVVFSETTMMFSERGMEYPGGRQTEWYLIR